MAQIVINVAAMEEFVSLCKHGGMERLVSAAEIVRDEAKRILRSKTGIRGITRIPGRYYMIVGGKRVPATNAPGWMERRPGSMIETIRVSTRPQWPWAKGTRGAMDVRIIAGTKKTWWATQMEYGRGAWKGGAKPFMRPALRSALRKMREAIENGKTARL